MIPLGDDNPTHGRPYVTYAILGLCVAAFLLPLGLGPRGNQNLMLSLGLIPAVLFNKADLPPALDLVPAPLTLLTSMFLHGGFMHLAGNMLYLWIFADNIEDRMGHGRFVAFYVLCGIGAALAQAVPDPSSQIPMIGASGAISGVLGAYLLLYPRAEVRVLLPLGLLATVIRLPALVVLGFWFLLQFVQGLAASGGGAGGGVAFRAHIGGFIAGMALMPLFVRRPRRVRY